MKLAGHVQATETPHTKQDKRNKLDSKQTGQYLKKRRKKKVISSRGDSVLTTKINPFRDRETGTGGSRTKIISYREWPLFA